MGCTPESPPAKALPGVVSITTHLAGGGEATGSGMVISSSGEVLHQCPCSASGAHLDYGDPLREANHSSCGRDLPLRRDLVLPLTAAPSGSPVRSGSVPRADVPLGVFVVAVGDAVAPSGPPSKRGHRLGRGKIGGHDENGGFGTKNLFQTDASINSENSGGPLLQLQRPRDRVDDGHRRRWRGDWRCHSSDQAENRPAKPRSGASGISTFLGIEVMSSTPAI